MEYMATAEALLRSYTYAVLSDSVLALAERSRCTAYDCEYVDLALSLGVPLVTSDTRLLQAFPEVSIAPASFRL
jgi:predicted nucleic acid-binding protein